MYLCHKTQKVKYQIEDFAAPIIMGIIAVTFAVLCWMGS